MSRPNQIFNRPSVSKNGSTKGVIRQYKASVHHIEIVVLPSTVEEGLEAGQCPDNVVRQDDHVDVLVKAGGEGGEELGPHLPLEAAAAHWVRGTGH